MNDHELENLLTTLAPARPSAALAQRVDRELEQDMRWALQPTARRAPRWLQPAMWTTLGAAAAVMAMSLSPTNIASSPGTAAFATTTHLPLTISSPALLPVSTIREIVDTQNEGIRYNETSRLPEQHMKIVSMERRAWIDPRDGAHITVEMPSEDSVILPVSFQ
ncbi:MAG: hypothetical protein V4662_25945 [Verrucomicrobiota bacterium]